MICVTGKWCLCKRVQIVGTSQNCVFPVRFFAIYLLLRVQDHWKDSVDNCYLSFIQQHQQSSELLTCFVTFKLQNVRQKTLPTAQPKPVGNFQISCTQSGNLHFIFPTQSKKTTKYSLFRSHFLHAHPFHSFSFSHRDPKAGFTTGGLQNPRRLWHLSRGFFQKAN